VMIQERTTDLLPEYLAFVQGVVDSEDLPLNVSRESYQANTVMANLKKTITNKVLNELGRMARKDTERYLKIFDAYARYIKQGLVVDPSDNDKIKDLLFFTSTLDDDGETMHSLADYVERMVENQTDIYYVMADDFHSARRSPHLDAFRARGIEVLYFTDPVDAAMLMGLDAYKDHALRNVDEADIDLTDIGELQEDDETPVKEALPEDAFDTLQERFKAVLGERVRDVRGGTGMVGSAARLVSDDAGTNRNMFRINRLLDREFEMPVKILELNPRHPLVHNLNTMNQHNAGNGMIDAVIEQVFETALLQDGIHPDPAAMATRLTLLMQAATGSAVDDLDFGGAYQVQVPEPKADPMAAMMEQMNMAGMAEAMGNAADDAPNGDDMPDVVAGEAKPVSDTDETQPNKTD